ncbi:MAG TPA: hypothetical protein VJ804_11800, partial [Acidimicrobiales bacterium]|nr:hypothetical protein [Acidimicrobiales bacterium]
MLVRTIAALTESIAVRVAALDAAAVPAGDAKRLVELGARLERLGHAVRLAGTAAMVTSGTWQGEGDRSAAAYVARTTGSSMSDAIGTVQTAEQLMELPQTAAAVQR